MPTPFFGDSDLPAMLKEVGVPITAGGINDFGILDLNDEVVSDEGRGQVIVRGITLEVQTSRFPHSAIATDAAITADGVNYKVREPLSSGDGALTKLLLRKA